MAHSVKAPPRPLGVEQRPEAGEARRLAAAGRAGRSARRSSMPSVRGRRRRTGARTTGKPPCRVLMMRRSRSSMQACASCAVRGTSGAPRCLKRRTAEQHVARAGGKAGGGAVALHLVQRRCSGRGRGSCRTDCRARPAGGAGAGSTGSRRAARASGAAGGRRPRRRGRPRPPWRWPVAELVMAHDRRRAG